MNSSIALQFLGKAVPGRAIIGLLGEESAEISRELQALGTNAQYWPAEASPEFTREFTGEFAGAGRLLLVDYTLERHDPLVRARAARQLSAIRRHGGTVLLATWHEDLLRHLCDEVWWIDADRLLAQGDPAEVLAEWKAYVAVESLAEQGSAAALTAAPMDCRTRAGDGRARVASAQLLNAADEPVLAWMSGEAAHVRVTVEFAEPVDDPVIGMLIRTRVGMHVYGTNTELETLKLGPRMAGDQIRISFRFRCDLCPGEYALTVASHDPDGAWHEWLEDAVAFSVGDSRYTAGVANLRAAVDWGLVE